MNSLQPWLDIFKTQTPNKCLNIVRYFHCLWVLRSLRKWKIFPDLDFRANVKVWKTSDQFFSGAFISSFRFVLDDILFYCSLRKTLNYLTIDPISLNLIIDLDKLNLAQWFGLRLKLACANDTANIKNISTSKWRKETQK